jgi:hypothetical protein
MTANMTADMTDMMIRHDALDNAVLRRMILAGEIRYGGNHRLGIYGRLELRVWQADEAQHTRVLCR